MSKLCGKWPTLRPCSACSWRSRSGPNVPASTSTTPDVVVDGDDAGQRGGVEHDAAERRHRRPGDPAAPAGDGQRDVMRGADAARRRRPRRSRPAGRPRRPAAGTSPASDQCRASGHQSRLASATCSSSSTTVVTARSSSSAAWRHVDGAGPPGRGAGELDGRGRLGHAAAIMSQREPDGRPPPRWRPARGRRRPGAPWRRRPSPARRRSARRPNGANSSARGRSKRWARVRRSRTSSSVVAISARTA